MNLGNIIRNNFHYIIIFIFLLLSSCAASTASKAYCDDSVKCLEGYECVKNKCEKVDLECSETNKFGYCREKDKECYDGVCKTLKEAKCNSVDCSGNGTCDLNDFDKAICICTSGYHPVGLNCVKDGLELCGNIECTDTQHCENDNCKENTKLVQCDRHITIPENGEIIVTQFEINWVNDAWEETTKCEWDCKQGFKKDETGELCIVELDKCSAEHPTGICDIDGYLCIDGACTPPPTMGSMCNTQSQCPSDMICLLNGIENGYCTKRCTDDSVCNDYKCGDYLSGKYCLQACNNILDCRSDFTCNNDKLCRPKCLSDSECKDYQICDNNSGLCVTQDINCDMFSDNSCSEEGKSCYPFDEISYNACAVTGTLENGRLCNKNNLCLQGSICVDHDNNSETTKRCEPACKPSEGNINNSKCEEYNRCISVNNWDDLGYCKYDSSLKPVGIECNSDFDCDYQNGTCMAFEHYNICVASDCPQQGALDNTTYPNEVMCVGMNVNDSWMMYWMDTCETDSDCYSSNFYCYENTSYPYPSKYCRPRP